MKLTTLILAIVMAATLMASVAHSADTTLRSNGTHLIMRIDNDNGVSAFNFTLSAEPTSITYIGQSNKQMDYNGQNVIVYGLNNAEIVSGDILDIEYDISYGELTVSITDVSGANGEALPANIEIGGDGTIAVTFSAQEVVGAVDYILGRTISGNDINNDGSIDIIDVQIIANNLEV